MSITEFPITTTPYAVVDLETTGLSPGLDRVVEVSVIRADVGEPPRLVLDTLVNPARAMAGTEIHGITDAHVRDAPRFDAVAPELLAALSGAVLISYNVYFDLRFLKFELERAGVPFAVPHLCAMYMRPLLSLGKRCTLAAACDAMGIELVRGHWAAADAIATAELLQGYHRHMQGEGIQTFRHLRRGKKYKFLDSLDLPLPQFPSPPAPCHKISRVLDESLVSADDRIWALREYQDVLGVVLADGVVTPDEARWVSDERERLGLSLAEARAVHARIFASKINEHVADQILDEEEVDELRTLALALRALGWSPGE
jgi:DNA polymerase III epsilon subunit-like protein